MMVDGIIKFIGSGIGKAGNSEVSPKGVEFDKFLSELFNLVLQNSQAEFNGLGSLFPLAKTIPSKIVRSDINLISEQSNNDLTSKESTLSILSMIYFPELLSKLNQEIDHINSKIEELKIYSNKLKIIFNQIDFDIIKSTFENSESLDNSELLSLLRKIYSSENLSNYKTPDIPRFYSEKIPPENLSNYKTPDILRFYSEKIPSEIQSQFKATNIDKGVSEIKENFDILNLNRNNIVKKDEYQVLLNPIIETSREEPLQKNTAREITKGENITINDKNLMSNSLTLTQTKAIEKTPELPVFKINEVSEALLKTLSANNRTLIVQLEPPELGKILIKLSLDNAGIKADLRVDYPHVKEMITGLIPEIKNNLQSSGIKLSDFVLDLMRDHREYRDSYQGQKKNRGNQKFTEYFA